MVALCIGGLLLLDSSIGGRRMQLLVVTITICPVMFIMGLAVILSWSAMFELTLIALQFADFIALVLYSATLFVEMGFIDPSRVNLILTAARRKDPSLL